MSARRKAAKAEPKPGRCLVCPTRVRFVSPRNLATGGTMHKALLPRPPRPPGDRVNYDRLDRIEAILRKAGLHEPGCPADHDCGRDHPEAGVACVPQACVCWLSQPAPETPAPGPHSRACGWRQHPHGALCARDCPTCHR